MIKPGIWMIKTGIWMMKTGIWMIKTGICMITAFIAMTLFLIIYIYIFLYSNIELKPLDSCFSPVPKNMGNVMKLKKLRSIDMI